MAPNEDIGSVAKDGWYVLADARLHWSTAEGLAGPRDCDGFIRSDIVIEHGRIRSLAVRGDRPLPPRSIALKGRVVLPAFVDCHTHLDKGHVWPRMPNPDGTFDGALNAVTTDRSAFWTADDIAARMEFALKCAWAHGTRAIRTHLDSIPPHDQLSWDIFADRQAAWAGRIELQASTLFGIDMLDDPAWFEAMADRASSTKGGVLGAVTFMVPDLPERLDRFFAVAADRGLDVDFHADEADVETSASLKLIAEAAIRNRFGGRLTVGHCCSLALQPDDDARQTLDLCAEAGLSVISLPMCNLYLQDRRTDGTTPRWRGVTLVHEMRARGIPVAIASDNTRDPFYAYGDLDMLEVLRMSTRILHLDHPVADWPASVSTVPAALMGLADTGRIAAGAPADLVVFRGRSWTELLSRPESDRTVIRAGVPIDAALPDYSELDGLTGMS